DVGAEHAPQPIGLAPVFSARQRLVDLTRVVEDVLDLRARLHPFVGRIEFAAQAIGRLVQIRERIVELVFLVARVVLLRLGCWLRLAARAPGGLAALRLIPALFSPVLRPLPELVDAVFDLADPVRDLRFRKRSLRGGGASRRHREEQRADGNVPGHRSTLHGPAAARHSTVNDTYINLPSRCTCNVTGVPGLTPCMASRSACSVAIRRLLMLRMTSPAATGTSLVAPAARATTMMP